MATTAHHRRALVLALTGSMLVLLGIVVSSAGTQSRASLLAQLERRAQPRAGHGFSATLAHPNLRGTLELGVNRASVANPARLTIAGRGGRPLTGAQVTLTYSMPSMGMWRVYSSRLEPLGGAPGAYAATQGVLGMSGVWRIDVAIAVRGGNVERFALNDRMPS